jgi:hypothetical protein
MRGGRLYFDHDAGRPDLGILRVNELGGAGHAIALHRRAARPLGPRQPVRAIGI